MKKYPFATFCWVNKDENIAQKIFPAHKTIYFSYLLKTNFLPKTIVFLAHPAFSCSNSAITAVEQSVKYVQI